MAFFRALVASSTRLILGGLALLSACGEPPLYERINPSYGVDGGADSQSMTGTGGRPLTGGAATGGARTGGAATGGAATGGAATGGNATGGARTGGNATGGNATGGIATGGIATGGIATGGVATGGVAMGGIATGGVATGGVATGGAATGGAPASGGATGTGGGTASGGSGPAAGALLHLAFDESSGTVAHDGAGTADNATLEGATFVPGHAGNAVAFSGQGAYATLPGGLTSSLSEMTVAFWVNVAAKAAFARVIDVGNSSTTGYWYVSVGFGTNGLLRFGITPTDWQKEQFIQAAALPLGQWKHVAVVMSSQGVSMYVDGAVVASSTAITLRPAVLGACPNAWLGRSEYSTDSYLNGSVDDLWLYPRALSASEVAALMTGG